MNQVRCIIKSLAPGLAVVGLVCGQARAFSASAHLHAAGLVPAKFPRAMTEICEPVASTDLRLIPFCQVPAFTSTTANSLRRSKELLTQMRDLAQNAINGNLESTIRAELDAEFMRNLESVIELVSSAAFGDLQLFDGSEDVLLQGRPPAMLEVFLDLPDLLNDVEELQGQNLGSALLAKTASNSVIAVIGFVEAARQDLSDAVDELKDSGHLVLHE